MEKQSQPDMSKPANKAKRVVQSKVEPSVFSDRVYWAVIGEDPDESPQMLVRDRRYAENMKALLPPELRAKVAIVRTYVTVWQLDRPRGRRAGRR
jgi:hypothetical protein